MLFQRERFVPHVMVSAGQCVGGKRHLLFVDEKAKVNATYYLEELLPKLVKDCEQLLPNGFIFQQDGAPAHARNASHRTKTFLEIYLFVLTECTNVTDGHRHRVTALRPRLHSTEQQKLR